METNFLAQILNSTGPGRTEVEKMNVKTWNKEDRCRANDHAAIEQVNSMAYLEQIPTATTTIKENNFFMYLL